LTKKFHKILYYQQKLCQSEYRICYKTIEEVETKFLGLQVDSNLNWKIHIQYIIPKRSSACFAMRAITSLTKTETLKLVYFAYFHSIMSYRIIFWGSSTDSKKVFYIQKKIIRIMAGTKRRASCRELFKKFNILPLASKFLFPLLSFVVDNIETFQTLRYPQYKCKIQI
jgi:hypothetical protein